MMDEDVPFFSNIDPDVPITKLESLCMKCLEKGTTTFMCTKIPYFQDIILTSFHCNSCGHKDAGYQSGSLQDRGLSSSLCLLKPDDISRKLALSEYATFKIPHLDFEIPPNSKQAIITTVEGILQRVIDDLKLNQPERSEVDPVVAEKIEEFITKLESLICVKTSFELIVDDPSGNSCIEEINYPSQDSQITKEYYVRSDDQNKELGLSASNLIEEEVEEEEMKENKRTLEEDMNKTHIDLSQEVQVFHTTCDQCQKPSTTKMKLTTIPYFSDVVIMATECSFCGYRSNEVKSGAGVNELGKKITLKITDIALDMSRDVLKSDTCSVKIPELDLSVGAGILISKFTTVEGLLLDVKEDLKRNPFIMGDSSDADIRTKAALLLTNIEKVIAGALTASLILDDPAGNSYLQSLKAPDPDPHLVVEEYERSFEQNEDLGLNDMKTENYSTDS